MAVFYTSGGVDGNAGLNLYGMLSSNFVLQYCTNLAGSNWMNLLSLSMRSVQRAGLVVQRGAPEQVFVLGVSIGDLGREQVKLRLVELHDRTDAVAIARLGEFKGLFGIVPGAVRCCAGACLQEPGHQERMADPVGQDLPRLVLSAGDHRGVNRAAMMKKRTNPATAGRGSLSVWAGATSPCWLSRSSMNPATARRLRPNQLPDPPEDRRAATTGAHGRSVGRRWRRGR